jgi:hypothetical protein
MSAEGKMIKVGPGDLFELAMCVDKNCIGYPPCITRFGKLTQQNDYMGSVM